MYVVTQYVGEVRTVLTVSTIVELAVAAVVVVTADTFPNDGTVVPVTFAIIGDVVAVGTVDDVVTA